jgi:hypothetical protein
MKEKVFLILCSTLLGRLIMAINGHARAEYAIEYTIDMSQREALGETIDKFKH